MTDVQKRMLDMLVERVEQGKELGIQLAAYYQGELVVDAWAGIADSRTGRPVNGSTLFPAFSTTKGVAATVIHLLAEQGVIDYDMPIRELWPEFAANGKESATIRQALNHTLGIPHMPLHVGYEEIADWDGMCSKVAQLAPLHPPGMQMHYHAITFGWILGEIARRATGRTFRQLMEEEICRPLGIVDLFVGIPNEAEHRVAFLEEPGLQPVTPAPPTGEEAISPSILPLHDWMNRADARRACIPASNGIMTAQAIARHYAALLPGGLDGVELLPPERVKLATEPLRLPNGTVHPVGLGYHLGAKGSAMGEHAAVFGHGGYGGSIAFADPNHRLAVGLVVNRLSSDSPAAAVIRELRRLLGISEE